MWAKGEVAVTCLCLAFSSIVVNARQGQRPAFLAPKSTALRGSLSPRISQELAAQEGDDAGTVTRAAGVRISKSGLSPNAQWITDPWDRGVLFSVKVDKVVHDVRSKFQHVQVIFMFMSWR